MRLEPVAPGRPSDLDRRGGARRRPARRRRMRRWRKPSGWPGGSTSCRTRCTRRDGGRCSWCCRVGTRRARTARSGRCSGRSNPQGVVGRRLQGAHRRSSWRTTISGGCTRPCRPAGRSGSSTARTTRTCSSSGSTRWFPRRSGGRATSRSPVRAMLTENGVADPQVLPAHLTGGAAGAAAGAAGGSRRSTGSSRRATWRERERWDEYTEAYRGGARRGPARRRRPGTSCPRTRNTCATCWWRRWSRRRWSGWIRSTPARRRIWSSSGGRCAERSAAAVGADDDERERASHAG